MSRMSLTACHASRGRLPVDMARIFQHAQTAGCNRSMHCCACQQAHLPVEACMASGVRLFPWASTTDRTASVTKLSVHANFYSERRCRMQMQRVPFLAVQDGQTYYDSTCVQECTVKIEHDPSDTTHPNCKFAENAVIFLWTELRTTGSVQMLRCSSVAMGVTNRQHSQEAHQGTATCGSQSVYLVHETSTLCTYLVCE